MNQKKSSGLNLTSLATLAIGGYVLWANRFRIQKFLEANGISTPWMTGSVGEAVMSGGAKVAGSIEHELKSDRIAV